MHFSTHGCVILYFDCTLWQSNVLFNFIAFYTSGRNSSEIRIFQFIVKGISQLSSDHCFASKEQCWKITRGDGTKVDLITCNYSSDLKRV